MKKGLIPELLLRGAIWLGSVIVAIFPSIHAAQAKLDFSVARMAGTANAAGFFRDFFFIVIVMSIFSTANLVDHFYRHIRSAPDWVRAVAGIATLAYILLVMFGTAQFDGIARISGAIRSDDFSYDLSIIWLTLGLSLATEIGIALRLWQAR